jgi:hypothetical protein
MKASGAAHPLKVASFLLRIQLTSRAHPAWVTVVLESHLTGRAHPVGSPLSPVSDCLSTAWLQVVSMVAASPPCHGYIPRRVACALDRASAPFVAIHRTPWSSVPSAPHLSSPIVPLRALSWAAASIGTAPAFFARAAVVLGVHRSGDGACPRSLTGLVLIVGHARFLPRAAGCLRPQLGLPYADLRLLEVVSSIGMGSRVIAPGPARA